MPPSSAIGERFLGLSTVVAWDPLVLSWGGGTVLGPPGDRFTVQLRATVIKEIISVRDPLPPAQSLGWEKEPDVSLRPPLIFCVPVTAEPSQKPEDKLLLPPGHSFLLI